jgi:hypothetical protein
MSRQISAAGIALVLSASLAGPAAAGCLKGAVVGAVAGHYAHHHAVLGAMAGCAVGHHMAVKAREKKAAEAKASSERAPDHH